MTRWLALIPLMFACADADPSLLTDDVLAPPGSLSLRMSPIVPGDAVRADVAGAVPGSRVSLLMSRTQGPGPCARGVCLDLVQPQLIATLTASSQGGVLFTGTAPATIPVGTTLYFQVASIDNTPVSTSAVLAVTVDPAYCPTVDPSNPRYDRYEGTAFDNSCTTDGDCMISGCSGEVCAAETVFTTCEFLPDPPTGSCGCVNQECVWNDVCP